MSVWISDEKLLIFASLISPSKMILFEKKYQTFDTVFHHQMKHCVSCLIYYFKHYMYYPCHYHGVWKLNMCLNAEHDGGAPRGTRGLTIKTKVYRFIIRNKRMRLIIKV